MTKAQMKKEQKYIGTMMIAKKLLKQGLISDEEYCQIDTKYKGKYGITFSTLFTDINLIKLADYGNM